MFVDFLHHSHTSGHDYLDVKRASCLMHTHWNTVYCGRSSSTSNSTFSRSGVRTPDLETCCMCCNSVYCGSSSSTFPGLGFKIPVKAIFHFFPSPNFLQRSINGEYFLNHFIDWLIDWLINVSCHWSHKKLPWLGFEPQTWKRGIWRGTGTATVHSGPMGVH